MIAKALGLKALPWILLGALVSLGATAWFSYQTGHANGYDERELEQLQTNAVIDEAAKAFDDKVTAKLAKLRPINKHITQQVETLTREIPVYRDCLHDQRVYDNVLRAYGKQVTDSGDLPTAAPASGQELRADDASANSGGHVVP